MNVRKCWPDVIRLLPVVCLLSVTLPHAERLSPDESVLLAASQPANLEDLKEQITQYKRLGGYNRDVEAVLSKAQDYIMRRAADVRMPAIVLDIDETSLSNWPQI